MNNNNLPQNFETILRFQLLIAEAQKKVLELTVNDPGNASISGRLEFLDDLIAIYREYSSLYFAANRYKQECEILRAKLAGAAPVDKI